MQNGLTFKPESVVRLPFLFSTSVSRIVFGFIEDVAGYIGKSGIQDDGNSAEKG